MTLAIILIVLLVDRMLWHDDVLREHRWYDRYSNRLLGLATGRWLAGARPGAFWFLLPPLLLVAIVQGFDSDILEFLLGVAVLLLSLGPHDLGRDSDAFLAARDGGDESRAKGLAAALCGAQPCPDDEPQRSLQVARSVLQESCSRLFGPLLWFILLGPVGAALYRLATLTLDRASQHAQAPQALAGSARRLVGLLDWLPARLTAAAFAAAGNFDAVSRAWRDYPGPATGQSDAAGLLATTGTAALGSWPDEEEIAAGEQPPVVEDAMALVWRTLVVWLLTLTVAALLGALL
jgi:membrane protein required for beta-lactamase induction